MPTREDVLAALTGVPLSDVLGRRKSNEPRRKNLGPAVKPSEGIRRIRDRLFGKISDWITARRRDEVLRDRTTQKAREELRESLAKNAGVYGKFKDKFGQFFSKAATKLGDVTAKLLGADKPLWDDPVKKLRKRPAPEMVKETSKGADMLGVNSTNVFSVGFDEYDEDPKFGEMTIQFRRESRVYAYDDCPAWLYRGLLSTESPGRYVWAYVRAMYDGTGKYRRVS
jgi:hypothetical protein